MGPTIFQKCIFCLKAKDRKSFNFETFGKKTFKLICHTNVYEAIKDIIEKTDDNDNA